MNSSYELGLGRNTHKSGELGKTALGPSVNAVRSEVRFFPTAGMSGRSRDSYLLVPSSSRRHRDFSG